MTMKEEFHIHYFTMYTGGEELVLMPINRAGPAFMYSNYSTLDSPDEDGENDEDEYQLFCNLWSPIDFKEMAEDAPGFDSNTMPLAGFIHIQTHISLIPLNTTIKCVKYQPTTLESKQSRSHHQQLRQLLFLPTHWCKMLTRESCISL